MKRTSLFLFAVLLAFNGIFASTGRWSRPSLIYCNELGTAIQEVERTDSTAVVYVVMQGKPGTRMRISPHCYLCDEKGNRYQVIRGVGLKLGNNEMFDETGQKTFSLVFPKLPQKVSVFDLVEDTYLGALRIYGIHDSSKPLSLPNLWNGPCKVLPEAVSFCPLGQARLKGTVVKPYATYIPIVDLDLTDELKMNSTVRTLIDSDGKFEVCGTLNRARMVPLSQDIQNPLSTSYVFLRPKKTAVVQVTDTSTMGPVVSYGKEERYTRLLPQLPYWLYNEDLARLKEYPADQCDSVIRLFVQRNRSLGNYLAMKYRLSEDECALLRTWIEVNDVFNRLSLAIDEEKKVLRQNQISISDYYKFPTSIAQSYDRIYEFLASAPLDNPNYAVVSLGWLLPDYLDGIMPMNRERSRIFQSLNDMPVESDSDISLIVRLCMAEDSVLRSICHYDKAPVMAQAAIARTFFYQADHLSQNKRRQVALSLSEVITDEILRRQMQFFIDENIQIEAQNQILMDKQQDELDEAGKALAQKLFRGDEGKVIHVVGFLSERDASLRHLENLLTDYKDSKDLSFYFVTREGSMSQESFEKIKCGVLADAEHCIRLSDEDYFRLLFLAHDSDTFELTLDRNWRKVLPISVTNEYNFRKNVRRLSGL